ncbi:hypothetical protein BGZ83_012183 [Gryganskiella cystojenkinii]|nr:hypothetical protein BGZ83_012183 [Gryganskiella cystojenkinii]
MARPTPLHINIPLPTEEAAPGYFEHHHSTAKTPGGGEDSSFHTLTRNGTRYLDSPSSSNPSSPMMTPLPFKMMMHQQQQPDIKRISEYEFPRAVKVDTPYQSYMNHPFMNLKPQPPSSNLQQQQQKGQQSQEVSVVVAAAVAAPSMKTTKAAGAAPSYSAQYASFDSNVTVLTKSSSTSTGGGATIVHVSPKNNLSNIENSITSPPSVRSEDSKEYANSNKPSTISALSMIENEKMGLHHLQADSQHPHQQHQQQDYFQQHHHHRDSMGGFAPPPPYLQTDHGGVVVAPSSFPTGYGPVTPSPTPVVAIPFGSGGARGNNNGSSSNRNKRLSMPNTSTTSFHSLASSNSTSSVATLVALPPSSSTSSNISNSVSTPPLSVKTLKDFKRHSLPVSLIKRPAPATLSPSVVNSDLQWPSAMTMSMGVVGSVVTRPQLARTMTPPPQATTLFTPRTSVIAANSSGGVGTSRLLERSEMERASGEMFEDDDEKRDEDFHPLSPLTSQQPRKLDTHIAKGLAGGRGRGRVGGSMSSLGGFQHLPHCTSSTITNSSGGSVVVGALTQNNLHHMHITGNKRSVATSPGMMAEPRARENFPGFFQDAKEHGSHWIFYSYGFVLTGALIWALMMPLMAPWAAVLPGAVLLIFIAQFGGYRWRRRQNNKQLLRDRQHSAVAQHAHAAAAKILRPHHLQHGHSASTSSSVRPNHSQQSSVSENDQTMSSIFSSPTGGGFNSTSTPLPPYPLRQHSHHNHNSPPPFLKSQFQHQYQYYYHRQSSSLSSNSVSAGSPIATWSASSSPAPFVAATPAKFSPPLPPSFPEGVPQTPSSADSSSSSSRSPSPPRTSFPSASFQSSRLRESTVSVDQEERLQD